MWNWIINKSFGTSESLKQTQKKEASPAVDISEGPEPISSSKEEILSDKKKVGVGDIKINIPEIKIPEIKPLDLSKIAPPPMKIDLKALEHKQQEESKLFAKKSGATISIMSPQEEPNIIQELYKEASSFPSNNLEVKVSSAEIMAASSFSKA